MKALKLKRMLSLFLALTVISGSGLTAFADEAEEVIPENEEETVEETVPDEAEIEVPSDEEIDEDVSEITEDTEPEFETEDEIIIEGLPEETEPSVVEEEEEAVLAGAGIDINSSNFPDLEFRNFVEYYYDVDEDGLLSYNERANVVMIDVYDSNIGSLEGIEYFFNLTDLYAQANNITSVDLSENSKLRIVSIYDNPLSSIDVSFSPWLSMAYEYGEKNDEGYSISYLMNRYTENAYGLFVDEGVNITYKKSSLFGNGWKKSSNGKWWFKFPDRSYPTGKIKLGNKHYVFDNKGYMITGWYKMNEGWVYAGSDGALVTGPQKIKNKNYLFALDTCIMIETSGWHSIEIDPTVTDNYYIEEDGTLATGWKKIWCGIDYFWFYFDQNGKAVSGFQTINGKDYYFHSNFYVSEPCMVTSYFSDDDGGQYFAQSNGEILKNKWFLAEGVVWVYFGSDGRAVNGWQKIDKKWYYFNDHELVTDTVYYVYEDNSYYMFDKNGVMKTNCWGSVVMYGNKVWFYFGSNGKAVTGWKQISGIWYYFREESPCGIMAADAVYNIKGKIYHFNKDGSLDESHNKWVHIDYGDNWAYLGDDGTGVTGWKKISGKWYYFDTYDGLMMRGWFQDPDTEKIYYFAYDGYMLCNTTQVIDGVEYVFDKNGVCKNPAL